MKRALIGLASSCLLLLAMDAHAQTAPTQVEAKRRFEEGVKLVDAKQYEQAVVKFKQAYSLAPKSAVLWNLALAELEAGHDLEALKHLRQYVRALDANPDEVKDAKSNWIPRAEARTGHIDLTAPEGAVIQVDGQPVERTGDPIDVLPGPHDIRGQLGTKVDQRNVSVAAGKRVAVRLAFSDAQPAGVTGPHESSVPVKSGESGGWRLPPTGAIVLAGVALVGAGAGVFFGLDSGSKKDELDEYRARNPGLCADPASPTCREDQSKMDDQNRSATISVVAYSVAGAALVGSVVWWVLASREGASGRAKVVPALGPGVAGISYGGSF